MQMFGISLLFFEDAIMKMIESGELSLSLLVGIILIWFFKSFWPGYIERLNSKIKFDQELRERELDMEESLREKESIAQREFQVSITKELNHLKTSLDCMTATFNDFLQNLLSQFIEERKDLTDTGVFRSKNRGMK